MINKKRIEFKKNHQGIKWIDVDMSTWQVLATCAASSFMSQRAFRFTRRGERVEYRTGSHYSELPADIESIK